MHIPLIKTNYSKGISYSSDLLYKIVDGDIYNFEGNLKLFKLLYEQDIDHVVLDEINNEIIDVLSYANVIKKIKVMLIVHDIYNFLDMVKKYKDELFTFCKYIYVPIPYNKIHIERLISFCKIYDCKVENSFFPISYNNFENKVEWNNRPYDYCYIGELNPIKFSELFIDRISEYPFIDIHCYGDTKYIDEYDMKLRKCDGVKSFGSINQHDVSSVLNKYRYFVLPHNGYELFNASLCQAICCGTIPLVLNDRNNLEYDYTWIDWAEDMYFGTSSLVEFVDNLIMLKKNPVDHSNESKHISAKIREKMDKDNYEDKFLDFFNKFMNEE